MNKRSGVQFSPTPKTDGCFETLLKKKKTHTHTHTQTQNIYVCNNNGYTNFIRCDMSQLLGCVCLEVK